MKNISRAVGIFGLAAKDIEALPEPETAPIPANEVIGDTRRPGPHGEQDIHFCMARDGVQLAWAAGRHWSRPETG